jgi:hypothetical protein
MTLEDPNVWSGGTPRVKAVLAFVAALYESDGDTPKAGVSTYDGVMAAVTAYDKAHTDNGWRWVHATDGA